MAWVETPQETFEDSVCAPMPHASSRSVAASHLADERPAHWDGPQRSSAQGSITQETPEQYVRELESKVNRLEGETQELAQKNARLEQRVEEREVAEPKLDSFGAWAHAVFAGDGDGDGLDSRERAYFERHRNNMEAALADALREVVRFEDETRPTDAVGRMGDVLKRWHGSIPATPTRGAAPGAIPGAASGSAQALGDEQVPQVLTEDQQRSNPGSFPLIQLRGMISTISESFRIRTHAPLLQPAHNCAFESQFSQWSGRRRESYRRTSACRQPLLRAGSARRRPRRRARPSHL